MLADILETIKKNLFLIVLIALISLLSFQLGKILGPADEPIKIEEGSIQEIFKDGNKVQQVQSGKIGDPSVGRAGSGENLKVDFRVVVSKNSDKYHFSWCPSAPRIKPENQIWFNTEEEAIAAGYTLAGNCSK